MSDKPDLLDEIVELERKLEAIKVLCLRHNNSSVTTGVQLFAGLVLKVIDPQPTEGGK